MSVLYLLWCLALPLAMSAPHADPLVADFRRFLETACREASHNLSLVYGVPDAKEKLAMGSDGWVSFQLGRLVNLKNMIRSSDCTVKKNGYVATVTVNVTIRLLQYSYDFSTNSKTFSDASGCVYGQLQAVQGLLSIEANMRNSSAVTATVRDFKFRGPGFLVVQDASIATINSNEFLKEVSIAVGNLLRRKSLPLLEAQVMRVMNGLLKKMTFEMNSTSTDPPTTPHHTATTTKPHTSKETTTKHPTATKDSHEYQIPREDHAFHGRSPSKDTIHIITRPRGGYYSRTEQDSRMDISCSLTRMSGNYSSTTADRTTGYDVQEPKTYRDSQTTDISGGSMFDTEETRVKDFLTVNFNNLVDTLMDKSGRQFVTEKLDPYDMPGGEELLYQRTDGSVRLTRGRVSGMGAVVVSSDPTVERTGNTAAVTVAVNFTDISFTFSYVSDSTTFPNASASVLGNITQLPGNLSIVANLEHAAAVTAELKSFQLLPTALLSSDFNVDVHHSKLVTPKFASEVADALIGHFKDNVGERLEDRATAVLRRAVAAVHGDMTSSLGGAGHHSAHILKPGTPSPSSPGSSTSAPSHEPGSTIPRTSQVSRSSTSSTSRSSASSVTHVHSNHTLPPSNNRHVVTTQTPNSSPFLGGTKLCKITIVICIIHTLPKFINF